MLRNPSEYLYSYYNQLVFNSAETISDFKTAYNLQDSRKEGLNLTKGNKMPKLLYYKEVGRLGSQLERLLKVFPLNQVHVILMDDFKKDVGKEYMKVLNFLDLPNDNRSEFPVINPNKVHRSKKIVSIKKTKFAKTVRQIKNSLGFENLALMEKLHQWNTVEKKREPLELEFRNELVEIFTPEVEILENILKRDLSHWKK